MARTKPSIVSVFNEKPSAFMTMNAAISEIGIVTAGIIVARIVPMKP